YPIDTFYIPEKLIEENRSGAIHSVVARTVSGDIVGHEAIYRSSPPNPNLYEYGVGLVLPAYRETFAFYRINQLLCKKFGQPGIDGIYGEPVCNHIITQKLCYQAKMPETAVEPALMPAQAYGSDDNTARVGCFINARVDRDQLRKLHVPSVYADEIFFILDGLGLQRTLVEAESFETEGQASIKIEKFDSAGVARCTVTSHGKNLAERLAELESELIKENYAVCQFFVDLGQPWSGDAVRILRESGFFLGGLLPIWFGHDGFLMQKLFIDPGFDEMKIYSDRGRRLMEMVREDWGRRVK
ncbi:MAG: hypothetical protein HQK55_04335, partial [Deltaproteobacteria bacterium]|nr:hypothetical protein [Deltaproteobacteria bacterium]